MRDEVEPCRHQVTLQQRNKQGHPIINCRMIWTHPGCGKGREGKEDVEDTHSSFACKYRAYDKRRSCDDYESASYDDGGYYNSDSDEDE